MDLFDERTDFENCCTKEHKESKYYEIAYDVAGKIAAGDILEGETIYAKSSVASQYGVSNETARRALNVLNDYGIVEIIKGSGVKILSRCKAIEFVRSNNNIRSFADLREELTQEIAIQNKSYQRMEEIFDRLQEKAQRFRSENPFVPYEARIHESCPHIGKTLMETQFWQTTSATVIAIRRRGKLILSPGPMAAIQCGDTIFFVGDQNCSERVNAFLNESK